jgi:hypothetical protein
MDHHELAYKAGVEITVRRSQRLLGMCSSRRRAHEANAGRRSWISARSKPAPVKKMQRTRRQHMNTIDAASLARWIVITAFVAVTGLIYVYLTVQLNRLGDRKKALELELGSLRVQSTDMSSQIANLTSRPALERRLKEGYLKLVPITERYVVRFSPIRGDARESEIQPVVNQRR